jgi:hypothetical protein
VPPEFIFGLRDQKFLLHGRVVARVNGDGTGLASARGRMREIPERDAKDVEVARSAIYEAKLKLYACP